MEPNKNYFLVGSFVLLGILGLIAFALWLTNSTEKREYAYYKILFQESVGGLSVGSPVKYRGVDIGNVTGISIDFEKADTIITRIRVLKGSPVRETTAATLKIQGITGTSYIELSGGSGADKPIEGASADRGDLPEIPSQFSNIATLSNEVPELIGKVSTIATQAGKIVDDQGVDHAQAILRRWDNISRMMEIEATQLDKLMKTTNHLVETTDRIMTKVEGTDIAGTMADLRETSAQMRDLATNANQAASTSFEEMNQLMIDAKKTSREFRTFTRSLGENPSQVLFPVRDQQETLP